MSAAILLVVYATWLHYCINGIVLLKNQQQHKHTTQSLSSTVGRRSTRSLCSASGKRVSGAATRTVLLRSSTTPSVVDILLVEGSGEEGYGKIHTQCQSHIQPTHLVAWRERSSMVRPVNVLNVASGIVANELLASCCFENEL